ncbi:MAG: DUF6282 family protein [Planctomycetota bacterium]|jgi:hypothetical protein
MSKQFLDGNEWIPELIQKSYDLHVHVGPDILPRKYTPKALKAEEQGSIAGIALKTHGHPAVLDETLMSSEGGPRLIPSVTLNGFIGGINPETIYSLAQTARDETFFVWLPTISAVQQLCCMGEYAIPPEWVGGNTEFKPIRKEDIKPIHITKEVQGRKRLTSQMTEFLDEIKTYKNLILATGHVSWQEAETVCYETLSRGIKTIITHPMQRHIAMPVGVQNQLAKEGAFIEYSEIMYRDRDNPGDYPPRTMAEQINRYGAERCILTSDAGQVKNPAPSQCLGKFVELLTKEGITKTQFEQMLVKNPRTILGVYE